MAATNKKMLDGTPETALTSAARAGQLDMTRWLLDNGVTDPNMKDGVENTVLAYATKGNFPEVTAELRSHGAT